MRSSVCGFVIGLNWTLLHKVDNLLLLISVSSFLHLKRERETETGHFQAQVTGREREQWRLCEEGGAVMEQKQKWPIKVSLNFKEKFTSFASSSLSLSLPLGQAQFFIFYPKRERGSQRTAENSSESIGIGGHWFEFGPPKK